MRPVAFNSRESHSQNETFSRAFLQRLAPFSVIRFLDYTRAIIGSPVLAVADGTVVIAEDLFFEGNAVLIDHGDGLISMYFHLADIKVEAGEDVKRGHTLGRVGSTGRATGPHLFFGVRWHNARINPQFVLEDAKKIPSITQEQSGKR